MVARALYRYLVRTPWSTAMAVLGVCLAVTSIVSVHLISAVVVTRLDAMVAPQLAGYTHFLHLPDAAPGEVLDGYFDLRARWRRGEHAELRDLAPVVDETLLLGDRAVRLLGLDMIANAAGAGGSGPTADVASGSGMSLDWEGVWVDESLREAAPRPVNGILASAPGTVLADIGVAQSLLEWPETEVSYVALDYESPYLAWRRQADRLVPGFGAGLPKATRASPLAGWTLRDFAEQNPASQFGRSVLFNISALGMLALLVAWFLIYQVAVSWLRRLWGTLERLHVIGVGRTRLAVSFLGLLVSLGALAATLGLFVGQALAGFLYALALPEAAQGMPTFALDGWVLAKAYASALVVCAGGGAWAYYTRGRPTRSRGWSAALAAVLAIAVAVVGVVDERTGLVGAFVSIAIAAVMVALVAQPLLRWLSTRAARLGGNYVVRLSVREIVWYPRELSVALSGLALAVATAIGVSLMVDSFRADFERLLDRRLSYDIVVDGPPARLAELAADADAMGVKWQGYWRKRLRHEGLPTEVVSTQIDAREAARYGSARGLDADEVLISEQFLRAFERGGGRLGRDATLAIEGESLRVAGVFASFGDLTPRLLRPTVGRSESALGELYSLSGHTSDIDSAIALLARAYPGLGVQRQDEIRRAALELFDQTFEITTVLIVIAMLVAGIGVYVSITTMRLNRATSTRLLHTLGVNRKENFVSDLARGIGVAALAAVLAVPLGLVLGWILCAVVNPRAFGWTVEMEIGRDAILVPLVWGLVAAVLAGCLRLGRDEEGDLDARNA